MSIIDIRKQEKSIDLVKTIENGLKQGKNKKYLPTLVLYDEKGLQLFDKITYLEEYYLTCSEIDILEKQIESVIKGIPDNSIVVELGSGSLRKTKLILDVLDKKRKNIQYYALDLSEKELIKSLDNLEDYKNVKTFGFHGTYEDGIDYLKQKMPNIKKTLLWLGSSIGNMEKKEAIQFLEGINEGCLNKDDKIVIGFDFWNGYEKTELAYNDPKGVSKEFILNGLSNVNSILSSDLLDVQKFAYKSVTDEENKYHQSLIESKEDQEIQFIDPKTKETVDISLTKGETIHLEYSFKYTAEEIQNIRKDSGLQFVDELIDTKKMYTLQIWEK